MVSHPPGAIPETKRREDISMNRLLRSAVALAMTLVLGACGSGSTQSPAVTTAPATAASTAAPATGAPATAAASAAGGGGAAAACTPAAAGAAPTAQATIKNFAFSPEPVKAKVGDVIGWTNGDNVGHTVTLDDGTCTTDTIASGKTAALSFSAPGTYAYHCSIHTNMKGTITITG
jgi:plastocyanin